MADHCDCSKYPPPRVPHSAYCSCHSCRPDVIEPNVPDLAHDPVNHPSHYVSHPSGVECITITEHMNFNLGNAMKYIWRAGLKDSSSVKQDLEKAVWYLNRELKREF